MEATYSINTVATAADASYLFVTETSLNDAVVQLAALIEPEFLAEAGWDETIRVLYPPHDHPLLGRRVCKARGCLTTAPRKDRICASCRSRLRRAGLAETNVDLLDELARPSRGPGMCRVGGCEREWLSALSRLCSVHEYQHKSLGVSIDEFCAHPSVCPLAQNPRCQVASCPHQSRHPSGLYCEPHQQRLRSAMRKDPALDEQTWWLIEPPIGRGGQVSLRGLPLLVVAQLLLALQRRSRFDGVITKESDLRAFSNDLRRQQVSTIHDYVLPNAPDGTFQALVNSLTTHARRAVTSPENEVQRDEWDLFLFGNSGTLSFEQISQQWLKEATKRWAADDLPKRRSSTNRAGLAVRHHIGSITRFSESLRMRPDGGQLPAALSRSDIEAFLNRLKYQHSLGQISLDARVRACREVRSILSRIRAMGLTRPGGPAPNLAQDMAIYREDIPEQPEKPEPARDIPTEIMAQLCVRLSDIASVGIRCGIELAIDTGRRPEEICGLSFSCLVRDQDGLGVLIYDNHKANRLGRRLPISEATAQTIVDQQARVREAYPDTPISELKLLPTDRRNPHGTRAITAFSLAFAHRVWVNGIETLRTTDGMQFDRSKAFLYAYRHTYAQRHADAGVPIDVLRELMDHRKLDTTKQYYRVGEDRRREAVNRVAGLHFDREGKHVWHKAAELVESEFVRNSIGEVAVPFGICVEPSNVKAHGKCCPFRFRCIGCDHFRTDVSYLSDLHTYLDELLRNRERLLAAKDIEDWARLEAMPSDDEIARIRHLIYRIKSDLEELSVEERSEVEQAVSTIRLHRNSMVTTPRTRHIRSNIRSDSL